MSRRSRTVAAIMVIGIGIAVWQWPRATSPPPPAPQVSRRVASPAGLVHAWVHAAGVVAAHVAGTVVVSGSVIDEIDRSPVGNVEIVFRDPRGDATTIASADGTFAIAVSPGTYRAFVRDDAVLSVGFADHVRLDSGPHAETAGAPDLSLMPLVIANADTADIELGVTHGGIIEGRVVNGAGAAVAHAVVRARSTALRPALGTDVAETDDHGGFELRVPPGRYRLDASHAAYAGSEPAGDLVVEPGAKLQATLTLAAGCVITGRVVRADGTPANDGAIEREREGNFGPTGRVEPDGTFRWTTREDIDVVLRAWPWKSPPSQARQFHCVDGARFADVVLRLPLERPDIEGVLVDATGAAVPFGYIDVKPSDRTIIGQQERADANGRWQIYEMPPGSYELTATAPGRGIAVTTIAAPRDGVRLQLGGTGQIAGTTTGLTDGSFEASFVACGDAVDAAGHPIAVARETRVVPVGGGRFAIDGVPACHLLLLARWRGATLTVPVAVAAGDTAHVELDLGPPRDKTIHGVVRDGRGQPVANARVTAIFEGRGPTTASTDAAGHYSLQTFAGASLIAGDGDHTATAAVGRANVGDEQVDLVLGSR